jgi:shikimate kinase
VGDTPARVVLVGFMGSGKSAVGRALARRLGYRFDDMDRRIERRTGRSIPSIFQESGEDAFREEECREARALANARNRVVATGGGAFVRTETREALRAGALTVWLECNLETALSRIPKDGSRPKAGNHVIMRALLAEREPFYRLADLKVDASRGTPAEVATRIVDLIQTRIAGDSLTER